VPPLNFHWLQLFADGVVHRVNLGPCLGDDRVLSCRSRLARYSRASISRRLSGATSRMQPSRSRTVERFNDAPRRRRFDGLSISIYINARSWLILRRLDFAVGCLLFRCFQETVFSMARSASEACTAPCCRVSPDRINRPFMGAHQVNQRIQLLASDLPRLIHEHHRPARHGLVSRQCATVGSGEPSAHKSATCWRCGARTTTGRPAA